ncbi:MAG: glutathione S-transferase N-terminal domain-containing protein [Acidiferrobacterales bacterium]
MKLYGSDTSPYVRKVRIVIAEKKLDCDWVLERPADAGGRFRELNPLGKIPVLETDSGNVIYDSPVIAEYLDSLTSPRLIPETGEARWQVQTLHALGDGMMDATVARMLESRKPEDKQTSGVVSKQEGKIATALGSLNSIAVASFLAGDSISMADIAIATALSYIDFRYAHDWRSQYPVLATWAEPVFSRDSFTGTVPPTE